MNEKQQIEMLEKEKDMLADQMEELHKQKKQRKITLTDFEFYLNKISDQREKVKDELRELRNNSSVV